MIDLSPENKKIVINILNAFAPEHEVGVFGSRARGPAKPYSDLDIVVMSEQPLGSILTDLKEAFSESDLPFKVDVLDWATTSTHFRELIKPDYVPLKAKP